jgi:hypothetical protein
LNGGICDLLSGQVPIYDHEKINLMTLKSQNFILQCICKPGVTGRKCVSKLTYLFERLINQNFFCIFPLSMDKSPFVHINKPKATDFFIL